MSSPAEQTTPESGRETVTVQLDDTTRQQMQSAEGMLAMAQQFAVTSQEDYNQAAELRKQIKARHKALDEERKKAVTPLDRARKVIQGWFKPALDTLDEATRCLDGLMGDWWREQERIRREEEARIRREQEKEAEKRRRQAEKRAERLRAKGNEDAAQQAIDEVEQAPPPPAAVVPRAEQPADTHMRTYYRAEVGDKMALIRAVAEGKVPHAAVIPDQKVLDAQARSLKQALDWPGVRVVEETKPVTRR